MTIQELMQESYKTAKDKGWTEDGRTFGDHMALIHSEVSEALESFREHGFHTISWTTPGGKPEGIPAELADVMIRVAQFCQENGINLEDALQMKMAYNKKRPYRHGGKKL